MEVNKHCNREQFKLYRALIHHKMQVAHHLKRYNKLIRSSWTTDSQLIKVAEKIEYHENKMAAKEQKLADSGYINGTQRRLEARSGVREI